MATSTAPRSGRPTGTTKNLRAISLSLVAKVRSQRVTTSTALANELAREAVLDCPTACTGAAARAALEKNVRRRLYDSLKVLVSVGAISRVRRDKTLRWNGVSHLRRAGSSVDASGSALEKRVVSARTRVMGKIATLKALRGQGYSVLALCARNRALAKSGLEANREFRVHVPFVVVRAPEGAKIQLDASPDARRLKFKFDSYFEVVNDSGIIQRLFPPENDALLQNVRQQALTLPLRKRMYAVPPPEIGGGMDRVLPHEIGSFMRLHDQGMPAAKDEEFAIDMDVDLEENREERGWEFPLPDYEL